MGIKILISLDKATLPKSYYSIFYSIFKQTLERNDLEKYNELFDKYKTKNFCFSLKLDNPVFQNDSIVLNSSIVTMNIRSYDEIELMTIYNAFLKDFENEVVYPMNCNRATIKKISLSKLETVDSNTLFVKMISPLVVKYHNQENNKDWYYTYRDDEFLSILKSSIKNITDELGHNFDLSSFDLIPINPKRTVLHIYKIAFPVTLGTFIIKGNRELLNFLYLSGIGSLRSSGCGMFDILGKE